MGLTSSSQKSIKKPHNRIKPVKKTASLHSQKSRGKRWHKFIHRLIKKTPRTIIENKNPRGYCHREVSGKTFATWGLNLVLGCTNLTLAPTGFYKEKQERAVMVN